MSRSIYFIQAAMPFHVLLYFFWRVDVGASGSAPTRAQQKCVTRGGDRFIFLNFTSDEELRYTSALAYSYSMHSGRKKVFWPVFAFDIGATRNILRC